MGTVSRRVNFAKPVIKKIVLHNSYLPIDYKGNGSSTSRARQGNFGVNFKILLRIARKRTWDRLLNFVFGALHDAY
jgi:hypothetical protein